MLLPNELYPLAKDVPISSDWLFGDDIKQGLVISRLNKKLLK